MFAAERHNLIVSLVNEKGSVKIEDLEAQFDITRMTIWRDLKILDEKGLIKKVYGGAVKIEMNLEPSFKEKTKQASEEKDRIAKFAVEKYIQDGDIISLGAGSTILRMMPYLENKNLTIYTNGLENLNYATKYLKDLNIICSGGSIRHPALIFVGEIAEKFFLNRENKVNTTFLSGTGITIEEGIMDPHPLDIRVKQAMINNANRVVILMDSTKINKNSVSSTIGLGDIDHLVLDDKTPKNFINSLKKIKIDVKIAKL